MLKIGGLIESEAITIFAGIGGILVFALIRTFIVPLLDNIPPVVLFALAVKGIFILALGLEVWLVNVKIAAIELVSNPFVRQCVLQ